MLKTQIAKCPRRLPHNFGFWVRISKIPKFKWRAEDGGWCLSWPYLIYLLDLDLLLARFSWTKNAALLQVTLASDIGMFRWRPVFKRPELQYKYQTVDHFSLHLSIFNDFARTPIAIVIGMLVFKCPMSGFCYEDNFRVRLGLSTSRGERVERATSLGPALQRSLLPLLPH